MFQNLNDIEEGNTKIKDKFSNSLVNRIDNIIIFNKLTKDNIKTIIINKLNKLQEKYPEFIYDDKIIEDIIEESNYKEFGARRIDKIIKDKIENQIINTLIKKEKQIHIKELIN